MTGQTASSDAASPQKSKGVRWNASLFGIKATLQIAFGIVTALTLIAAATSFLSFSAAENVLQQFVSRQIPGMNDSMRLSIVSEDISAAAARYISAKTVEDQEFTLALIAQKRSELAIVTERVRKTSGETEAFQQFTSLSQRMEANLASLEEAITERTKLHSQITSMIEVLSRAHGQIINAVSRLNNPQLALEISEKAHLIANLIREGSLAQEPTAIKPLQDRFNATYNALRNSTATLARDDFAQSIEQLGKIGQGITSVFARRARELFMTTRVDGVIDENVAIQRELDSVVAALVNEAERAMEQGTHALFDNIDNSRLLLLFLVLAIFIASGIAANYVQRKIVRRLLSLEHAMQRLSSGEINFNVSSINERDEIGRMARALEVFRASEIERRGLADRERTEQIQQRRRAQTIDQIIGNFRATITTAISSVTENISHIETTARSLSTIAYQTDRQAHAVSASSEETSTNMRSMADASDQLDVSIREINQQATQAHGVIQRASDLARSTDQLVGQLSAGVDRIGNVVKLIRDIAEQTNLLALNATIEAARAGESGRGFAVVASEVKALASQTAGATEDITTQVTSIQTLTNDTVNAIRSIGTVMKDIDQISAVIAGAVAQQTVSTETIAQNVQQASVGANQLADNMAGVTKAADATMQAASVMLQTSEIFLTQAGAIESAIDSFLKKVAAA